MTIEELRRQRAAVNAQVQELATIAASDAGLTAEQNTQFEQLSTQFEQLSTQIGQLEAAERMQAAHATPVQAAPQLNASVGANTELQAYPGAKLARFTMAIAAGGGNLDKAATFAEKTIGDVEVVAALDTGAGSGAALIPENWASEVIELLRPKSIVRKLGAISVEVDNGNLTMPRVSGGATSTYTGEGQDATSSNTTFDDVKLATKELISLVPMSNNLIGRSGYRTEQLVLNDMIGSIGNRSDIAFLRGDGSNDTPTGMLNQALAGNKVAWSGPSDLATIDAYLDSLILKLMTSNSMMVACGWGMCPRTWMKLFGLRDGNGNKVYPEMKDGLLKGYPIEHTTAIPSNLGAGTNETEIYFADFNDVLIGETSSIAIDFSKEATYKDGSGNLVSAFSKNQSLLRVITANDLGCRHAEGIVIGQAVTW